MSLIEAFKKEESSELRESILVEILDLITGDWDLYCMSARKIELPEKFASSFKDLEKDPEFGKEFKTLLKYFN